MDSDILWFGGAVALGVPAMVVGAWLIFRKGIALRLSVLTVVCNAVVASLTFYLGHEGVSLTRVAIAAAIGAPILLPLIVVVVREVILPVRALTIQATQLAQGDLTQDIGSLPTAEERNAVFLIRNTMNAPMTLVSAKPDCDCVSIELPTAPIPVGGAQRVVVHFNGRAPAGALQRGITVHTDGDPATLRLIVTGNINSRY